MDFGVVIVLIVSVVALLAELADRFSSSSVFEYEKNPFRRTCKHCGGIQEEIRIYGSFDYWETQTHSCEECKPFSREYLKGW